MLKGMELGPCTTKWTVDYLSQAAGSKEVKIHVSAVPQMDFLSKNFVYRYFHPKSLVFRGRCLSLSEAIVKT